jgi:hypothetical protein
LLVILAVGAIFASWAALTLMGGERARRLNQLQAQKAATPPPTKVLSVSISPAAIAHPVNSRKQKNTKPPASRQNTR